MKSQTVSYRQLFSIFIVTMLMTLVSCSVSKHSDKGSSVNNQLGAAIQTHLAASNASSESELSTALSKIKISKAARIVVSQHRANIIDLYRTDTLLLVMQNQYRDNKLAENLADNKDTPSAISTLVRLFPIDAYRILTYVTENSLINEYTLLAIAVENKLDPTIVLEASAFGIENSVTPLIHSAGIVIYGQDEDNTSDVRYREVGDNTWLPALELAWEPIYGALSGSIVHLNADTAYEVEVEITDYDGETQEYSFDFKTRPNSPPIDPNKIYYLSEIYSGGELDLEALNIHGSEGGYAKIIGDGQVIDGGKDSLWAVNVGSQAYIMLENLTITGGRRYGIYANKTHDIWISNCDISSFGRKATLYKNDIAYENSESNSPINYDSGIYLERTGKSVIEHCKIHSPNEKANHWGSGHPKGPNALQIHANNPVEQYQGQIIIRYNQLFGTAKHRFNDVIEGRKNTERTGGFVRDSAIYGNYLAYANDDLIEIDGGQQNVLVYNNELTSGYVGISIAPNMLGPSYVFHNYIHDLSDERGKEWTAIKAGGLMVVPGGKTYILENYINTNRNGISASGVKGDSTFWVEARNNVIINRKMNSGVGLGIYDKEKYHLSKFVNNIIFNTQIMAPFYDVNESAFIAHPATNQWDANWNTDSKNVHLNSDEQNWINNFSRSQLITINTNDFSDEDIFLNNESITKFHNQAQNGTVEVLDNSKIVLKGNGWYKIPIEYTITENTNISFEVRILGDLEVVGIALETDNKLTADRVIKLAGSQNLGIDYTYLLPSNTSSNNTVDLELNDLNSEKIRYVVFILDNDIYDGKSTSLVEFSNLKLYETSLPHVLEVPNKFQTIPVGLLNQ
jgi:hypothetical protein